MRSECVSWLCRGMRIVLSIVNFYRKLPIRNALYKAQFPIENVSYKKAGAACRRPCSVSAMNTLLQHFLRYVAGPAVERRNTRISSVPSLRSAPYKVATFKVRSGGTLIVTSSIQLSQRDVRRDQWRFMEPVTLRASDKNIGLGRRLVDSP